MDAFKDCNFISREGDIVIASYDGNILKISNPGIEFEVELRGVMIDNWYENGNIRIRMNENALEISTEPNGFPLNTVRYLRFDS